MELVNALTETTIAINYLNNQILTFENKDIIYPGKIVVAKGYGLPAYQSDKKGDLIIQFEVIFPKKLSNERKHYLKKILTTKKDYSKEKNSSSCSIDKVIVQVSEEQTKKLIQEFKKTDSQPKEDNNPRMEHFGYFESPLEFSSMGS